MYVVSVENPEQPYVVGSIDTPGEALAISIHGENVYIADNESGLRIISVTDPENPVELGSYDTQGNACDVSVFFDYVYLADGIHGGVRVISVLDPENPVEMGYYDTPGTACGVTRSRDGLIYVADRTNLGIYRATNLGIENKKDQHIPLKSSLNPAYPNPFNSTTTITYGISHPGIVSMHVYNPLGQRISTLLEGHKHAGFYTADFSSKEIPTGLYYVQFKTSKGILTRTLTVIK